MAPVVAVGNTNADVHPTAGGADISETLADPVVPAALTGTPAAATAQAAAALAPTATRYLPKPGRARAAMMAVLAMASAGGGYVLQAGQGSEGPGETQSGFSSVSPMLPSVAIVPEPVSVSIPDVSLDAGAIGGPQVVDIRVFASFKGEPVEGLALRISDTSSSSPFTVVLRVGESLIHFDDAKFRGKKPCIVTSTSSECEIKLVQRARRRKSRVGRRNGKEELDEDEEELLYFHRRGT